MATESFEINMKIKSRPIVYDPVNRCIYCGATDCDLRREHIIPFALGGNFILPKSSCRKCEKITGRFEQYVLSKQLKEFRIRHDYPTRNPKNRPKNLVLLYSDKDGITKSHPVSIQNYPSRLFMLQYPTAGILEGKAPTSRMGIKPWNATSSFDISNVPGHYHEDGLHRFGDFELMLAKIGHSFAIAQQGFEAVSEYQQLLPKIIIGEPKHFGHVIGGDLNSTQTLKPKPGVMHELSGTILRTPGKEFLITNIQLFSDWGAPKYHTVVGVKNITNNITVSSSNFDPAILFPAFQAIVPKK